QRGARGRCDLLGARTDGSAEPVVLSAALADEGCVSAGFAIDPGSVRVVYAADPSGTERLELFSSPLDGRSAPVRLSETDGSWPAGSVGWYGLLPDGESALYQELAGQLAGQVDEARGSSVLWRVSLDTGRRLELGRVQDARDFRVSADGRRLACLE